MSKWIVKIEVDDDVLRAEVDQDMEDEYSITQAINDELGWVAQSGIIVKEVIKDND